MEKFTIKWGKSWILRQNWRTQSQTYQNKILKFFKSRTTDIFKIAFAIIQSFQNCYSQAAAAFFAAVIQRPHDQNQAFKMVRILTGYESKLITTWNDGRYLKQTRFLDTQIDSKTSKGNHHVLPQCLKITQNVTFECFNFGIFHQFLS